MSSGNLNEFEAYTKVLDPFDLAVHDMDRWMRPRLLERLISQQKRQGRIQCE